MTARETERLAIVETKMNIVQDDIREIKQDIKTILGSLEQQNSTFISKRSGRWILGIIAVIVAPIIGVIASKVIH